MLAGPHAEIMKKESAAQHLDTSNCAALTDAAFVHRHAKRLRTIAALTENLREFEMVGIIAPDPMDPNISKRRWEIAVMEWRQQLRRIRFNRPPGL